MRLSQLDSAPHSERGAEAGDQDAPAAVAVDRRAELCGVSPCVPQRRSNQSQIDADCKADWVALLGHELRNPVGAIGLGLELVQSQTSEPERLAPAIEMMQRQVAQIVSLLDALLDAARVTADKVGVRQEPVDLGRVVSDALDSVGRLIEDGEHEISVVVPPASTVWVTGDHNRLVEAVINILANAAKYTPRGGRIALALTADADAALITVRDSGIGIRRDFLPRVFDLFTQGDRVSDGDRRGLGLGLPLARNHIQLHGGSIAAFSDGEGHGSRFEVRLPRARPEPAFGTASRRDARTMIQAAEGRRVLIVEDEPDQADALRQLLAIQGHETRAALNGPAALGVVQSFKPDVALIDLGLPGMDGYELAHQLRKKLPQALFIAVTGYRTGFGRRGLNHFDHHVIKPVDFGCLSAYLAAPRAHEPRQSRDA